MFTAVVLFLLSITISTESERMYNSYPNRRSHSVIPVRQQNGHRVHHSEPDTEELIPITVYYGSLCLDSRKFFMEQVMKAYELLGSNLDIRLVPYGKAHTRITNDTNYYEFDCQSGPYECYGNKLHACALDLVDERRKAVMFIACMMDEANPERGSNDEAAEVCGHTMEVDSESIKDCASDSKGALLLHYYGEQSGVVRYSSIPYVLVDGVESDGKDFVRDICNAFLNPPRSCQL